MTIKSSEQLSMAEVIEFVEKENEDEKGIVTFIKKFNDTKAKDAKEMKKLFTEMNNMKIKPDYIVKMIDLLPESPEELNKIFVDVSLDEDETKKILETIKQFK